MPHVRPDRYARVDGRIGESFGELLRSREWRAGPRVCDELDPGQQAAPAHLSHVGQFRDRGELLVQHSTQLRGPLDQFVLLQVADRRDAGGAAHRMV